MPRPARSTLSPVAAYRFQHSTYAFCFALYATYASVRRVVELGFDPFELVLVGTVLEASVFLLEIPTGALADLRGRRISVMTGYAIVGAGFALEAASQGLAGVLLAQVLWGGGWTFISGARSAWLADEIGAEAAAPVMLSTAQLSRGAALLGIAVSAGLAWGGLAWPLGAAALGMLGLAATLPWWMGEAGFTPRARREGQWREMGAILREGLGVARGRRVVALLIGVGLFAGASSEAFDRLWVLHLTEGFGTQLPPLGSLPGVTWFAALQALALGVGIASLGVARRLAARVGEGAVLAALYGALAGAVVFFAVAGGFVMAVAAWLCVQALRSPLSPLETAWANRHIPTTSRATVLSMLGQADALGQVLGGPGLGLLGRRLGVASALLASAMLLVPGAALLRLRGEEPGTQPGSKPGKR